MVRKSKDLTMRISNRTAELGSVDTNLYTEDKGIGSFRFIFRYDNSYVDLTDGYTVQLDLFHSDGSIWINEPLISIMPNRGLVQYSIRDNVMNHAGKVDAKVFLKRDAESIHVANFNFNIIDSGITGAVEKEISVNLIENTIRNIIEEEGIEVLDENFMDSISGEVITFVTNNPENFKGEKGDKGDKFTFSELTPEQKLELKGDKGDKGDSIQGPQGPQGERGLQGLTGARGPAGADGQDGTVTFEEFTEAQRLELKGEKGEQGPRGPKGDTGDTGATGAQGLTGSAGPKGDKGDTGDTGHDANIRNYRNMTILNSLPLRFPGYDALVTSSGNTYYYPQGLALDDEYLYVLYSPTGSGNQRRLIVVYNRSTNAIVRKFYAGSAGGESIHVQMEGGSKFLYAKSSAGKLGKYNISTLPADMTEKTPTTEYSVGLNYNFTKNNNEWIIEQDTATRKSSVTREVFAVYDSTLTTVKRYFTIDPSVGGYWGSSLNFDTPKRQGIAALDGNLYQVVGGNYYVGNPYTPYRAQGVQSLTGGMDIEEDFTYNPNELVTYLTGEGYSVTRIEHESAFVYNGEIYALVVINFEVPNTNGVNHRYLLVKYGAQDAPLTMGENSEITVTRRYDPYMAPINGKLRNEFNGTVINSMKDLIKYMYEADKSQVLFYSTDVAINDENGTALAEGITVRVESATGGIYWVEYMKNRASTKVLLTYVKSTDVMTVYPQNLTPALPSGLNLNNVLEEVNGYAASTTNGPGGSAHGFLEAKHTGSNGQQIFRPYNSATRSFRYYKGGSWSAWTTI